MAKRDNHYDLAFEEYLRSARIPYVVVDEKRRALMADTSLKSMDFIVYSSQARNLLVDVKGRRFPSGAVSNQHKWENWTPAEDVSSLIRWQEVFGGGFRAVLLFAYQVVEPRYQAEFDELFHFGGRTYSFFGVWAEEYRTAMQLRSLSWSTVSLPSRDFRKLRAPVKDLL